MHDVHALLQHRAKPASRYTPRVDSFASSTTTNTASDDDHSLFHHPYYFQSAQEEKQQPELDDLPPDPEDGEEEEDTRMSVMGPKIRKNAFAPWELEPIADDNDNDSSSIFGVARKSKSSSRKSKEKEKAQAPPISIPGRSRSKTISPVSALKGLGLGKITTYDPTRKHSFASSSTTSNSNSYREDDAKSISTATVTDVDHSSSNTNTSTGTGRTRSKTVSSTTTGGGGGNTSIDMGPSSRPLPTDARKLMQLRASHLPGPRVVRPEDMFAGSFTRDSEDSVTQESTSTRDQLHPYSRPEFSRVPSNIGGYPSEPNSNTSTISASSSFLDSSSSSFSSPSCSTLHSGGSSSGSTNPSPSPFSSVKKKKAPPPPLTLATLRSTPSNSSLVSSSTKQQHPPSSLYNLGNGSTLSVRPALPIIPPTTPTSRTPSTTHLSPSSTANIPEGMLAFPGSPAYRLISLEDAQAKLRPTPTTTSKTPVLRQRKSGFLKFFGDGGKEKERDKEIGPPTPVGWTAGGLPSPFEGGGPRTSPMPTMVLKDRADVGGFGGQQQQQLARGNIPAGTFERGAAGERQRSRTTGAETTVPVHLPTTTSSSPQRRVPPPPMPMPTPPQKHHTEPPPSSMSMRASQVPFVDFDDTSPVITTSPAKDKEREKDGIVLRLRHMSTNFMDSVPLDYLSAKNHTHHHTQIPPPPPMPMLSPATPSFNSIASSASETSTGSSGICSPSPNSELEELRRKVKLQEDVIAQLRSQLLLAKEGMGMCCGECGSSDLVPIPHPQPPTSARSVTVDSVYLDEVEAFVVGGAGARRSAESGVMNRPRVPTGYGTRFGSRFG